MAETPPRVPPQQRSKGSGQSAGGAPLLGAAKTKKVKLDETAFGARFNGPLVHESVRAELNARRRGTASTKTRGQVRGAVPGAKGSTVEVRTDA